jgi:hypothetical protein
MVLARKALEAVVRNETDLLAILDGAPMVAATSALPRRADIGDVADQVR